MRAGVLSLLIGLGVVILGAAAATGALLGAPKQKNVVPQQQAVPGSGKGLVIGYATSLESVPVVHVISEGIKAQVKRSGAKLIFCDTGGDLAKALDCAKSFKTQGVQGVLQFQHDTKASPAICKAGPQGVATAEQGIGGTIVPITFKVQPFVLDAKRLVFYIVGTEGLSNLQSPIIAPITNKGRKLRLEIPPELRKPGGTDASLTGLNQTFAAKKGKSFLVSSAGCKSRKHVFGGKLIFATDRADGAAAPAPLSTKAAAKCKK